MSNPWQKPFRGTLLNRTHPLARGLVGAWVMNEGSGNQVFDLSGNGNDGTIAANTVWGVNQQGFTVDPGADNQPIALTSQITLNPGSVEFYGTWDGTAFRMPLGTNAASNYVEFRNTGVIRISDKDNTKKDFTVSMTAGTIYHCVATYDGTDWRVYLNGFESSTGAVAAAEMSFNTIGHGYSDTTYTWLGDVLYCRAWNRVLAPAEVVVLHREPYAMFSRPSSRRIRIQPAAVTPPPSPVTDIPILQHHYRQCWGN